MVCLFVCIYVINFQTAEPIGSTLFRKGLMLVEIQNCVWRKCRLLTKTEKSTKVFYLSILKILS